MIRSFLRVRVAIGAAAFVVLVAPAHAASAHTPALAHAASAQVPSVALATPALAASGSNDEQIARVLAPIAHGAEPGCVAAAAREGGRVHTAAVGLADLSERTPLSVDSVFNIASVSKQFTAFAVLLLEQRGALTLDDPIVRYVPELSASASGVTIRHLLHHTGGLRDYSALLTLQGRKQSDAVTREETIEMLAWQRSSNTRAGTAYEYSNTGYFLLSVIVERVSKQSLAQFSATNIFEPLGMTSTSIVDTYPARIRRLAHGYAPQADGFSLQESVWEQTGDGQVHSTAGDLLRWSANLATGRVGGAIVLRMLEPGVLASGERLSYAAGLVLDRFDGRPAIAHRGTIAGYRAYLLRLPTEAFSVAVLCNRSDVQTNMYAASIARLFVKPRSSVSPRADAPRRDEPSGLLDISQIANGWYRDVATAAYLNVERTAQSQPRLMFGGRELSISETDRRRYRIAELGDASLTFARAADGVGAEIHIEAVPFHGRFIAVVDWPAPSLKDYFATYRSDEAAAQIIVEYVKGQPVARIAGERTVLHPAAPGELRADDGQFVLRFEPVAQPRALYYYRHGVHGLRFERQ